MKIVIKFLNFLGCVAAFAASLGLILILMMGAGMYTVQSVVEPERMQQLLVTVTMPDRSNPEVSLSPEDALIQQLMESPLTRDLLELYTDDLFAQMNGGGSGLDAQDLYRLAQEHMRELLPIMRLVAAEAGADLGEISDEELETQVLALVGDYGGALLEKLPTLKDMGVAPMPALDGEELLALDMEILDRLLAMDFRREDLSVILTQVMALLQDGTGLKLLLTAAGILSLLILVFRLGKSFRGFVWLCWDYLIAGGMSLCLGFGGMTMVSQFAYQAPPQFLELLQQLVNPYLIAGGVILGAGILLGILAAVGNSLLAKHRAQVKKDE